MNHHSENKTIKVLGIDLAKQSFQLHGVNAQGHTVLRQLGDRFGTTDLALHPRFT